MESDHTNQVSKHICLSLPNVSGALTMTTATISGAGGIVDEVHRLHKNTRQRMVELDIIAASEDQWAAIIQALTGLDRVRIEGEADPALEAHHGGLIGVQPIVSFRSEEDFSTFYTSGAASVAHAVRDSVQQEQAGPTTCRPPSLPKKEESYDVAR